MSINYKNLSIALVVFIVGLVIGLIVFASRPSMGTITKYQPTTSTTLIRANTLQLKGDYFSLKYKNIYGKDDTTKVDPKAFEQHTLTADASYKKVMAIIIDPLEGSLQEESSYNLRTHHAETYSLRTISGPAGPASVMTANDRGEQVIYFVKNGKVAILALTTTGPRDDLNPEVEKLVQSFEWVQ